MSIKMYAQFDENGICMCVGTPNITNIEATYENNGQKYIDGVWYSAEVSEEDTQAVVEVNEV